MKPLIWKEFRENLKWVGLPSLFILLPMILLGSPNAPMFSVGGGVMLLFITAVFGAALGFLQLFFESRGDQRAILLHRPLSRSRIFLAKAIAGGGIYLLAMLIPFVCVQAWFAVEGHIAAPYHWQTGLPWLADILAGLVYYFAGMLTAQREARWYGSRGLGLAAALVSSILVWTLPEFWQALVVIVLAGALVGVAAWGSFLTGGAYEPQPPIAKAALVLTFLAGLSLVSVVGKFAVGQWFDSGRSYGYTLDRQGRMLLVPWKSGIGPTGSVTDLDGRVPRDLRGKRVDRNLMERIEAPLAGTGWPMHRSYRSPGRFYVRYSNDSTPGNEAWLYARHRGLLLGYDANFHQFIGSFGPDGFVPAGQQAGARFQGELRYPTRLWETPQPGFLVFPGGVYTVDFARRSIQTVFTPAHGETVLWAAWWNDRREKHALAVVSTDTSIHIRTPAGAPVLSVPRAYDLETYAALNVGRLEDPQRYLLWYAPSRWLEPEHSTVMPHYLLEYDAAGNEIARRTLPPRPWVQPSPAQAWFGLATPPAEVLTLVPIARRLRWQARLTRGMDTSLLGEQIDMLITYSLPMAVYCMDTTSGLLYGFTGLSLLGALACGLVCFLLARRYCFSRARRIGWSFCGFLFGPTGLFLMLAIQEWPVRISCPMCRQPRRVDHDRCQRCGAAHEPPPLDGTEIIEAAAPTAAPIRSSVHQAAILGEAHP